MRTLIIVLTLILACHTQQEGNRISARPTTPVGYVNNDSSLISGWPVLIDSMGPGVGFEGTIWVTAIISADGNIKRIHTDSVYSDLFNKIALRSVEKMEFTPGSLDGVPVEDTLYIGVVFVLK